MNGNECISPGLHNAINSVAFAINIVALTTETSLGSSKIMTIEFTQTISRWEMQLFSPQFWTQEIRWQCNIFGRFSVFFVQTATVSCNRCWSRILLSGRFYRFTMLSSNFNISPELYIKHSSKPKIILTRHIPPHHPSTFSIILFAWGLGSFKTCVLCVF